MGYLARLHAHLAVALLTASCLAVCAQESPSSEKMDAAAPDPATLEAAQALAGAMFSPDIRAAMIESMKTIETTHAPGLKG
ncbi:MAG TPA: hypothetical protein VH858_10105 [Hyphomicrobiales bacterium]